MASTPSLKQARLGDPEAIAQVIQYLLPDQNTTVHTRLQQDYLEIILESPQVPDRASSVEFINQVMRKIGAKSITTVLVQGRELGKANVAWKECRDFTRESENKKTKSFAFPQIKIKWPVWFPYPSSWLRAIALLLWTGIVLRIFQFWGLVTGDIAVAISQDNGFYLTTLAIGLLGAISVFAFLHHLFLSRFKKAKSKLWVPGGRSWWEGTLVAIILLLSVAIVLILMIPFFPAEDCYYFGDVLSSCYYQYRDRMEEWNNTATWIWLIAILYLYQAEFLLRKHIPAKSVIKFCTIALVSCLTISSVSIFARHTEYIGAAIASFGDRTSPVTPTETVERTKSEAIAPSQEEPKPIETAISEPEKPEPVIPPDPFSEAVNKATIASNLAQTADSEEDWNIVAQNWEDATELMGRVPPESDNYEIARDRVIQYQKNFDYSRTMATKVSAVN